MKKRSLARRAEWSITRETSYRVECEELAYRGDYQVVVRDGIAYKIVGDAETVLLRPVNPKRIWYETWLVLKGEHVEPCSALSPAGSTREKESAN